MPSCSSPVPAWRPIPGKGDGSLLFSSSPYVDKRAPDLYIPCGRCVRCKLNRASDWAVRCMHEASLYEDNCFVTLTYDDVNAERVGHSLCRRDLQLFLKRLRDFSVRTRGRGYRFYGCGEYGERFGRPHYHLCLFDFDFKDKTLWRRTDVGNRVYRSERLEALWPFGSSEIGSVNYDSAGYVARYCLKKITGEAAAEHYHFLDAEGRSHYRVPEFPAMSLKPGIGVPWLERFHTDVYNGDFVVVGRAKLRAPRTYDLKYEIMFPSDFERVKRARLSRPRLSWLEQAAEGSFARFSTKEEISVAKLSLNSPRKVE